MSKGKRLETVGDRTFARQKSSCFVAYVHVKCLVEQVQKKNRRCKFWPDHVSDRFRLFPTVSDRFIFSERLIGPLPFMEG